MAKNWIAVDIYIYVIDKPNIVAKCTKVINKLDCKLKRKHVIKYI